MTDPFNLQRFVVAQAPVFEHVLEELKGGKKQSHWMWFVFPQLKGLGSSLMAQRFAIGSRAEAEAYLAHPVLGPRLLECTELMNGLEDASAEEILGPVDSLKFRSSMTLFAEVAGSSSVFAEALQKYFAGKPDDRTIDGLARG